MNSICILGGTFNPPHKAHIEMAYLAMEELSLPSVVFMPDSTPPHKCAIAPTERLELLRRAIEGQPGLALDDREIKRGGYTYTIDTVKELLAENPDTEPVIIVGADSLMNMEGWMRFEELAGLCRIFAVKRAGTDSIALEEKRAYLQGRYGAEITISNGKCSDISSTEVRRLIMEGNSSWEALVPENCVNYIKEHRLYIEDTRELFDILYEKIMPTLNPHRWHHTLGVIEKATEYAQRFGADTEKARLAALLHDCAKPYKGEEALALMEELGIEPDEQTLANPEIWHGPIGAGLAKKLYNIDDKEILDSIYYHTTGRRHMTLMDKVIKLADLTERSRDYPGVDEIRHIAETDLDLALLTAIENTESYLEKKGIPLHHATGEAILGLKENLEAVSG